jgi:hypothetical protein
VVEVGVDFVAGDGASEVVQLGDGAFDLPASGVGAEPPAVLRLLPLAALAVRADQLDPPLGEPLSQRIAVGRPVLDEPRRDVAGTIRGGRS